MAVTLKDVAALAKVSRATASLALNGKEVNDETRKIVLEAAKKLNYYKSSIARNLITGKSHTIGVYILNSAKNVDLTEECTYFYLLLKAVIEEIEQVGYSLNFEVKYWEDVLESNYLVEKAYSRSIDGMLIVPQYLYQYSFIPELEKIGFPYVVLNPSSPVEHKKSIFVDNYKGVSTVVEYLAGLGFKNIGFINGPKNHNDSVVRERSFIDSLVKFNLNMMRESFQNGDFTIESGYKAAREILSKGKLPEVIFCANDYMGVGAMRAFLEKGIKIPEDISIVGFDDTDVSRAVFPRLTTLHCSSYDIGKLAAQRLLAIINSEVIPNEPVVIEPKLLVRESSRTKVLQP